MDSWKRGKDVTQVGKQFIQKAVYIWNASHVFLKENRICAELYKKQSNGEKVLKWTSGRRTKEPNLEALIVYWLTEANSDMQLTTGDISDNGVLTLCSRRS